MKIDHFIPLKLLVLLLLITKSSISQFCPDLPSIDPVTQFNNPVLYPAGSLLHDFGTVKMYNVNASDHPTYPTVLDSVTPESDPNHPYTLYFKGSITFDFSDFPSECKYVRYGAGAGADTVFVDGNPYKWTGISSLPHYFGDSIRMEASNGIAAVGKFNTITFTHNPATPYAFLSALCIEECPDTSNCGLDFDFDVMDSIVDFNNLTGLNPDNTDLFEWNFPDGDKSTEENPTHTIAENGQSKVINDFMFKMVAPSTPPQFDYSTTPADGFVYQVAPGEAVNFNVKAFDVDPGSSVSLSGVGLPIGSSFNPGATGNPTTGTFSWTPSTSQLGTSVMNFTAQDNNGVQAQTAVSVIVSMDPVFDVPPTPASGVHNVVAPGQTISFDVQVSDPDPTDLVHIYDVTGKDMSGNAAPLYAGASLSPFPTTPGNPTTGTFTWTPSASQWGHRHVFFNAKDTYGGTTKHEVSILVNNNPEFTSTPITSVNIGETYTYNVVSTDADIPFGDAIQLYLTNAPSWLTLTDNGDGTGTLTGTPGLADVGSSVVTIESQDINHHHNVGGIPTQTFSLEVLAPDNDKDGIPDAMDLDDDNDGIMDGAECTNSNFFWSNAPQITGANTAAGTINGIGYTYSSSRPVYTTSNVFAHSVFPSSYGIPNQTAIRNIEVSRNTLTFDQPMTNPVLVFSSIGQGGIAVPIQFETPVQVLWSTATTINSPTRITGREGYAIVRLNGTFSSISFDYLAYENYVNFSFGADFFTTCDTDGDGIVDQFDLDSDNDGCPDAIEAGHQDLDNDGILGNSPVTVDANGLVLSQGGYTGSNNVVVDANLNGCNEAPEAVCKNITLNADANCSAVITAADVDGGSSDPDGDELTFSIDNAGPFSVGTHTVTLTVADPAGESDACNATVTVQDVTAPVALAKDLTVQLDANGNASITANEVNNGSNDACGIASLSVAPNAFNCANVGNNTVTLTVTDVNGNVSTVDANVTVEDNVAPVVVARDITAQLDASGNVSITAADVDNGSNDACGIASLSVAPNAFNCANVGNNIVTLTVIDVNGNVSTVDANVTVEDNVAPIAVAQNVTIQLDENGNASVTAVQIDNGSNDACGIASIALDKVSFDCSNLGDNTVELTVVDVNGNSSATNATVTVVDEIVPTITCPSDIHVVADRGDCDPVITWGAPVAADNCSFSVVSNYESGEEFPVGSYEVVYTVTDIAENNASCSFNVTVEAEPLVITNALISEYVGGNNVSCFGSTDGSIGITVEGGCLPYTYEWNSANNSANASNLGAGTHTVTVTDANGTTTNATYVLNEPALLETEISDNQTVYFGYADSACADIAVSTIGGIAPYNVNWSTGSTATAINVCPETSSNYSATVTDANGCTTHSVSRVCVIDVIDYAHQEQTSKGNKKGNGPKTPKILICHKNGKTLSVSINAVAAHLAHGDLLGDCDAERACSSASRKRTVDHDHDHEVEIDNQTVIMEVYPNPAANNATVSVSFEQDGEYTIAVFNMIGERVQELYSGEAIEGDIQDYKINASALKSGIYFVNAYTSNGVLATQKLIVTK